MYGLSELEYRRSLLTTAKRLKPVEVAEGIITCPKRLFEVRVREQAPPRTYDTHLHRALNLSSFIQSALSVHTVNELPNS
jgi:hypothetical protein